MPILCLQFLSLQTKLSNFLVKITESSRSMGIFSVGIKYSMLDRVCDAISYCACCCDVGKIGLSVK